MKVRDYCEKKNYDGHLILKSVIGTELVNTINSNGEFPFDANDYEISFIESENSNVVVMVVK